MNGRLYGVSPTRLYTIDPATAQATQVGNDQFPTLIGNVDIDFDPVTDMLRVVTDTNQNVRIHPDTAVSTTDTAIAGVTGIAAIAYTNNFASPDRANLYGIGPGSDQFVLIGGFNLADNGASQNQGVATAVGALTIDVDAPAGLDIAANDNDAFAVLTLAGDTDSGLYRILETGAATFIRDVAVGERLRGLALFSRASLIYAVGASGWTDRLNRIATILSAAPTSVSPIATVDILGLNAGESVQKIATRPVTGQLVGLTSTGRLLIIDPRTGQTSFLSQINQPVTDAAVFSFHPTLDRLLIMQPSGQNLSVHPDTGTAGEQASHVLTGLLTGAYAADGSLYVLASGGLYRFADPPTGVATAVGTWFANAGSHAFLDFGADGTGFVVTDAAVTSMTHLRTLSIPDGQFSGAMGPLRHDLSVPGFNLLRDIAVAHPGRVRFSVANYNALENAGSALITLQREMGSYGPIDVRLSVSNGTATTPDDFIGVDAIVGFADGEITKTLSVPIVNDALDEAHTETVSLALSQPRLGATLGTPASATLTITDNDPSAAGADPTITITSPTTEPTFAGSSLFLTLAGTVTDPDSPMTAGGSVNWSSDRGFSGTGVTSGAAPTLDWSIPDVPLAPGVNTITVTGFDADLHPASDTIVVTVTDLSYFLAEGATGTFFDFDLLLANPNATAVNVTATFLKPSGQGSVVQHYTLAPTSRMTVDVETIAGLENAEVSTIVTAPAPTPIVVERTMRWDSTGYGAHTDKASPSLSNKWYFAEGAQGFFFTYLLLVNPHDQPNSASVTYFRENTSPVTRTYDIDPHARATIDVGADADLVNQSFGMEVTFLAAGARRARDVFRDEPAVDRRPRVGRRHNAVAPLVPGGRRDRAILRDVRAVRESDGDTGGRDRAVSARVGRAGRAQLFSAGGTARDGERRGRRRDARQRRGRDRSDVDRADHRRARPGTGRIRRRTGTRRTTASA